MTTKVTYRILSFEERERDRFERQEKACRDQAAQQRWAVKQREFDMARVMIADGEPVEKIMKYTNLTNDEIESLKAF